MKTMKNSQKRDANKSVSKSGYCYILKMPFRILPINLGTRITTIFIKHLLLFLAHEDDLQYTLRTRSGPCGRLW